MFLFLVPLLLFLFSSPVALSLDFSLVALVLVLSPVVLFVSCHFPANGLQNISPVFSFGFFMAVVEQHEAIASRWHVHVHVLQHGTHICHYAFLMQSFSH